MSNRDWLKTGEDPLFSPDDVLRAAKRLEKSKMSPAERWEHSIVRRWLAAHHLPVGPVIKAFETRTGRQPRLSAYDMHRVYPEHPYLLCRRFKWLWKEPIAAWINKDSRTMLFRAFRKAVNESDVSDESAGVVMVTHLPQITYRGGVAVFESSSLSESGILIRSPKLDLAIVPFESFARRHAK